MLESTALCSPLGERASLKRKWLTPWPSVRGVSEWTHSLWVPKAGCRDTDPPPGAHGPLTVLGPGAKRQCWRTCRRNTVALAAFSDKRRVYSRHTDSCPSATFIYKMFVKLLTVGAVERKPREKLTLLDLVVLSSQPWRCFSSIY